MPSSIALDTFRLLIDQVTEVEKAAARADADGYLDTAPILRRSGLVLAVAGLDTFFHEQAVRLLCNAASVSPADANRVAGYIGRLDAAILAGPSKESYIRLGLSYKTLVSPRNVDGVLAASGLVPDDIWREAAFQLGSRPDRLRTQVELFYDRRNQIAHEGDWDFIQLSFRKVEQVHLSDCVNRLTELAEAMDSIL
jgi:hypothetical protein